MADWEEQLASEEEKARTAYVHAAMPHRDYLRSPQWRRIRQQVIERARHRCQLCNAGSRLQVHHRTYIDRGSEDLGDLVALCDACHVLFSLHRKAEKGNFRPNWRDVKYGLFTRFRPDPARPLAGDVWLSVRDSDGKDWASAGNDFIQRQDEFDIQRDQVVASVVAIPHYDGHEGLWSVTLLSHDREGRTTWLGPAFVDLIHSEQIH